MGGLTSWLNSQKDGIQGVMQAVIGIVAVVIGGICIAKAIAGFNKGDYKQTAMYAAFAVVAFVIAFFGISGFMGVASTVNQGGLFA